MIVAFAFAFAFAVALVALVDVASCRMRRRVDICRKLPPEARQAWLPLCLYKPTN